ncbi:hypothetical protein GPJ56_009300 [Histomonas meleagridis]|uniref:uncharacterized protein n=1 Tax=Histomonas meleagridis TaxID=135588 RepID=UPI003559B814|nr:hypothetical protein GPJ56_009300 [Histomonas meleagridis]KAH0797713.1 hypothetical protein GO595_009342 [Histomonas meleagridis]
MRNALVLIQSRKKNGLELVKLTKEKINEMFSAFENGKSLSCFHHSELFSFVLMLISSSEIPLIPPSLHDLIIKSMQAPSDIEKLELASVIICYLPVTTYFLLLEFVQIFGGIQTDPSLNRTFIPLFAIALFQNTSSNLNLEIEFLLFLFLFYTKAFGVPSRIAQELRIKDGVLYLMEESRFGKVLFSTKGSSNISLKDTKRYKFEPNIISLMDKYRLLNDDEILSDDIMKEFKTFSSKLEQVSDLFSEYKNLETRKNMVSKKRREAFLPLEVENYALSELKFSILPEHPNPSDCKSNDEFSSISEGNSSNKQIPSKQKSKISDSQQQDKTEEDINGTEVIQRKTETNEEEEIQNNNENIEAMNSQENEIEIIINNEEEEIELIDSDSEQSDSDSNKEEESKSENETNNVTMEQSNEKEKEIKNDNKKHPKKIVKTKRVNKTSKKIIKVKRKVNTNKRKKTIKNISKEETNKNKVNEEIITNREEVIYNEKIKTNNEEEQSKEKTSCNEEETILKPDENKEQIVTSETNGNDDEEPIHKSDENKEQIVKHDNTNEEEESVKSDEIVNNNEQNTINNDGEDEPNKSSSSETVGKDKEEQSNSSASKSDSNDNEEDPNKSLANETHEDDGEIHSNNENITKSDSDNKEDPSKSVETNNNNNEEDNKEEESDGFQLRERRNESPKKRFSMDAFNSLLESDDVINQLLGESKLSTNDFNDGDEQYTNELTIIDESKSSDKEAD